MKPSIPTESSNNLRKAVPLYKWSIQRGPLFTIPIKVQDVLVEAKDDICWPKAWWKNNVLHIYRTVKRFSLGNRRDENRIVDRIKLWKVLNIYSLTQLDWSLKSGSLIHPYEKLFVLLMKSRNQNLVKSDTPTGYLGVKSSQFLPIWANPGRRWEAF